MRINNSLAIRDVLVAGLGIGLVPGVYVDAMLRTKQLRAVLGDHEAPPATVFALYARQRHLSSKIRSFVDLMRDQPAAR